METSKMLERSCDRKELKNAKYINQYIKKSYTNSVEFYYVEMRTIDFMIRLANPRN